MKKFFFLAIAAYSFQICFSQVKDFRFRRKIATSDSAGWYSITLPGQLFKNLNNDFSDLRVYQFNTKDTIESPYILTVHQQQVAEETYHLTAFNQSKRGSEQYLTFELPKDVRINFIDLSFNETNFDASVTIEGSNDQREWFEIAKKQRLIAIANQHLNFYSGSVHFSLQNFHYLRARITADKPLTLKEATLKNETIKPAVEDKAELSWKTDVDKKAKQTVVNIELKNYQPIVTLSVEVGDKIDFYRPFRLERISDSTSTPKGWQYVYSTVASGFITSVQSNRFVFSYTSAKKMRLIIEDDDNTPVSVTMVSMFSPKVDLTVRMASGDQFLYYGNSRAGAPSYDLVNFKNKIPSVAPKLALGEEEKLTRQETPESALIQNKIWLWILMGVVIVVLGFFTVRMMKEKA